MPYRFVPIVMLAHTAWSTRGSAQQPAPATQASVPAYRAPVIALVQPALGGTIPQDKPVVIFRFAPGELTDPLDARSFSVGIDGEDKTALFQVTFGEAWGPLSGGGEKPIGLGAHQVSARICSTRGACADATTTVTVVPCKTGASSAAPSAASRNRRERLLDLVLQAARKLLAP
jgi:hypothetical protein